MNHDEIKNNLFLFHDGEIKGEAANLISDHLLTCSECENVLSAWNDQMALLKNSTPEFSEAFVERVMNSIAAIEPSLTWLQKVDQFITSKWFFPAFVSAALAGFIFIMSYAPYDETNKLEDTMLLTHKTANVPAQWLSNEPVRETQLLGYIMGEI